MKKPCAPPIVSAVYRVLEEKIQDRTEYLYARLRGVSVVVIDEYRLKHQPDSDNDYKEEEVDAKE